MNKENSFKYLA